MNYATRRNVVFSVGIALASLLLTAGLYFLIQAVNGSPWLTIKDSDAPVFSYISATVGISVAIVASLSTIFLALQAMGIAREHAIMSAREAYIEDVKDFRNDANEAERLVLELADKCLQHARAVRKFMIFRLPDFNSNFEMFENEADLAREFGNGILSSALLSAQDQPERRLRLAVEGIFSDCNARLPIDWSEENSEAGAEFDDIHRLIREQVETAATLYVDTPQKRENLLNCVRSAVNSELLSIWRGRGEDAVTRSKTDLVEAMAQTVRFILARDRGFMFAELVERNLAKPEVEQAIKRVADLVGVDELTKVPVHTGLDRLRYFVTATSGPSCVTDDDLKPNHLDIPSRADGRLGESLRVSDPFLPRIVLRDGTGDPWWGRPHAEIEHLEPDEDEHGVSGMLRRAANPHPILTANRDYEFFSFLIMALRDILDLSDAPEAIKAHLTATGMSADLARTASESYARTIRPSVASTITRHAPNVTV